MKTITNYTTIKETEKAVLIKATLSEIGKESDFWLPKSKIEIKGDSIEIDDDFYSTKLEEIKNPEPKDDGLIKVHSKTFEKGDKATKLIIDVKLNDDIESEVWLFIPNSQIKEVESKEDNSSHIVTVPDWLYKNSLKSSLERKLEFYNKDGNVFGTDDFEVISNVELG